MPDSSQLSLRRGTMLVVAGSLMTLVACTVEHARTAADSSHAMDSARASRVDSARPDTSHVDTTHVDTTHASTAMPAVDTAAGTRDGASDGAWRASARGVGAVTFGMTIDAAARVAGGTVAHPPGGSCGFTSLRDVPHGARFMVSYDTVVRVDVDSATVPTDAGARVGMREDSVRHLYARTLHVTPHKYVRRGHYLIVVPGAPADTMHQIIFETDGDRVTRYRAGLAPYVGYVEGCG